MLRMTNPLFGLTLCLIALVLTVSAQNNLTAKAGAPSQPVAAVESDRTRDGLVGPVRRVRTEVAKLISAGGGQQEGKHVVLEIVAYDLKGNKIENQYFPIAGSTLTGKEVYKYEFDFAGNWSRMTTSVAVVDGGKLTFEPTEVTYRLIMYYLDENMLKAVQPAPTNSTPPLFHPSTPIPITLSPAATTSWPIPPVATTTFSVIINY